MLLKYLSILSYFTFCNAWADSYQKKFGCITPNINQVIMHGNPVVSNNNDITLQFLNYTTNQQIFSFNNTDDIIYLKFISKSNENILFDVNHGTLDISLTPKSIVDCFNKRIYTTDSSTALWIYTWKPQYYHDLNIVFTYISSKSPIFIKTFTLPFISNNPNISTTEIIPTDNNLPQDPQQQPQDTVGIIIALIVFFLCLLILFVLLCYYLKKHCCKRNNVIFNKK